MIKKKSTIIILLTIIFLALAYITFEIFININPNIDKPNIIQIEEKFENTEEYKIIYNKLYQLKDEPNEEEIKKFINTCIENNFVINEELINLYGTNNYNNDKLISYIFYMQEKKQTINEEINYENIINIVNNNLENYSKQYNYEFDNFLLNLINEKFFVEKNMDKYIIYYSYNKDLDAKEIVTRINSGINDAFYTNVKNTDTSKGIHMIVNKYYKLDNNYIPDDLITIPHDGYGLQIRKEVYEKFETMLEDAKKEGIYFFITSPYRSYNDQNYIYNSYAKTDGYEKADTYSARAGHSEHQTGLAVDLSPNIYMELDTFESSPAFGWMKENCYKYGFILRYPKNKEYITGYIYEPWHYRYVGVEAATIIHDNDITFEEYYEYYENNNS